MQDPIVYQQDANSGSFCKWHSAFLFAMTPSLSGIWLIKPSLFPQLFISPVEKSDVDFVCNFLVIKEVEVFCILLNLIGGEVPCNNIVTYNAKYLCWCWPPEFQRQRQEPGVINDTFVQPRLHVRRCSGCCGDCKGGWDLDPAPEDTDAVGRMGTCTSKRKVSLHKVYWGDAEEFLRKLRNKRDCF